MSASIMGERLSRVMGASPQQERAYQQEVKSYEQNQQETVALAQQEDEVRREKRRSRLEAMQGQASAIRDSAMLDYGRVTGRPTAKDASGRVVTAIDDTAWAQQRQSEEAKVADTVAKERATERKAAHEAKVNAASLEEQRLALAANDPALRVMPDTDRKKIEEELATQRNNTLAGLMPEVEKRVAARVEDPEAREAALAAARMGQYDPEIVAEIERDLPDAFAGERATREKIAADDTIRARRDDIEKKRHAAAGRLLETKAVDPLLPEAIAAPRDAFDAPAIKRDLEKRHEDLATRQQDLTARTQSLRSGYDAKVSSIQEQFTRAIGGRVTRAQYALHEAERDAALIRARAEMERAEMDLAPERARLSLDEKDFEAIQRNLSVPAANRVPPAPQPSDAGATKGSSSSGTASPVAPDPLSPPATPLPVIDRGEGLREVEVAMDPAKPARELLANADATAREAGAEVYLRPDFADPSPDAEAPRPARIAPAEVEVMRTKAKKAIDAQGKQLEALGTDLVGQVEGGKLDADTARTTYEAKAREMLDATTSESRQILDEAFNGVLGGRMSMGQGRSIAAAAGIEAAQFDEMVAASVDETAKVEKLRQDLGKVFEDAAPQKDFWTSTRRTLEKNAARLTGQEGAAGVGRALADTLSLGASVLNIFRDTTGVMGGDKAAYQAEQVENRTADISRAIDETLARHETEAAALLAQHPDLSDADATRIKLDAVRGAVARGKVGLEEVAAGLVESPESYLPFIGDLVGMSVELAPVISASLKARRGEELNDTDEYFLEAYIEGAGRDHSVLGLAAEIVTQLPAFAGEVALTGGIGTGVKKFVAKGLGAEIKSEVLEGLTAWGRKKAEMRAIKEMGTKGLLARGAASLAGTTVQTPFAMADKIAADMVTKMTIPDLEGFDGDVQEWAKGPGLGFGHAMAQSGYDAWVEMVSESAGGLLRLPSGLTNRLAKSSWVRAAAKLNPATSTSAIGKFARRAQLHGPLGEIFEERVGDVMRGAAYSLTGGYIGDEFQLPTADQWAGEAIGMLAGNGAFAAINARATAEGKRANQRLFEQNHAPVAAFGDWSNSAQVADAINGAFGRDPGQMPYRAEEIEAIEAQIGPLAELPAVRRIAEADAKLADLMDRSAALDDLDNLGRATAARVAHTRARLESAMVTIAAHREAGRTAASLAEMGAPDQAAMVTGGQKLAAGRPLAELTAAERAAWMPQPVTLVDGTVEPAPVYVEEVNGRPIVTDAGKSALSGSLGADLTEALLPMPESKARRLALQPERKPWTPPASTPSSKATNGSPSAGSAASSSGAASSGPASNTAPTVGKKTTWRARGERGTVVEIPADAATSLDDAERQLAAMLPMGEMLSPDSVEPPSVRGQTAEVGGRQDEADADEIPGVSVVRDSLTTREPRPLDPVRGQVAALNLAPRDAKNAEALLTVIEGLGAQDIFEAIEFTDTGANGMEVVIESMTLRVNLPVLAQQVRGKNHLVTAAIEEIIHAAAVRSLEAEKVAELWRATPGALKKLVLQAYRYDVSGVQGDVSDVAAGHEMIRMIVQDQAFRAQITEAQDLPTTFAAKLLDILRDLVSALRKHLGKLDKTLKRDFDTQVETVIRTLEEFGVAVNRTTEAPERVRGDRGISPAADQAGAGAQRITADGAATPTPASREPRLLGSSGTAYTSTGEPIEFQWAVVEAGDLVTSHTDALTPNPVYDQTLQGRNRDSAASEVSVNDIEGNTVFARLSDAGDTAGGAPIVGPDLMVESGNGRSIALRRAYKKRRPNVAGYKADLVAGAARYGLDPAEVEALKSPVLVRVRRTEVDRVAFAEDANRPTVARLSEREVALQDAKGLSPSVLEQLEVTADGDLYTPSNQGFFRQFFRMNVSSGELPGLVDQEGRLTKTGLDRVRNAVFVSAYGADPQAMRIFERLVEEVDPDQRNVVNALVSAAPEIARYRATVSAGSAYPTRFPEDLIAAAGEFLQARADGARIEEYLGQQQMFETRTGEVEALIRFFDANVRSGRRIGIGIRNVLREIERAGNPSEMGLFGDSTPPELMPLIESGLARGELLGSEVQGEMALAMGAPAVPIRAVPKKHEHYITTAIERYFRRIEDAPGELDEMARQLVTGALKKYGASASMNPGEAVRSVLPQFVKAGNAAEQMSVEDHGRLARLLSLRILKAQAINEAFKDKVREIAAVKAGDWAPLVAPVKSLNRAFEKAVVEDWTTNNRDAVDEGNPWGFYSIEAAANNVQDLVRGSIIVQDAAEMPEALEEIGKQFNVLRVKDRWNKPLPSGYADYLLTVETEIGGAEFQIHIPEMLVAKEGWFQGLPEEYRPVDPPARYGHSYYVEQRGIAGHLPNAKEMRDELNAIMRQLYFSAILAHYERTGSLPDRLRKPITKFSQEGKRFVLIGFSSGAGSKVPLPLTSITSSSVNTTGRSLSPQEPNSAPGGAVMATVPESMPEDRADRELTQENLTLAMGAPGTPPVTFSYSLGIPRADMPQIRPERQLKFLQSQRRRGVSVEVTEMPVSAVKPTQIEYYPDKVEKALGHFRAGSQLKRAIVSREGFLLDGHHQYVAASIEGIPLPVIRVGLPVGEAFEILLSYDDVHEGSREVVRKQVEAHQQRMASLAMGAPAAPFQAEQFDLFGYESPDGGIRRIPRTKPSASDAPVSFQTNLFDWQPEAQTATLANDGNRTRRVGSRRPGPATGAGELDQDPQRAETPGGGIGDLFAWGGGPTAQPTSAGDAGQSGRGGSGDLAGGLGGDRDAAPGNDDGGADLFSGERADADRPERDLVGGTDGDGPGVAPTRPKGPAEKPLLERPTDPAARNFELPDGFEPSPGGVKSRIEANFAAIKLLRAIEEENRDASPEEKKTLVRYTGWGSYKEAFNELAFRKNQDILERVVSTHGENWATREYQEEGYQSYRNTRPDEAFEAKAWMDRWGALHERLKEELTRPEFEAAFMSIANAHYTAAPVIDAVWTMARKAGFRGGRALEPSAGVGHFIGRTPADLADRTQWDAIELDHITSKILGKLYPESRVNSQRSDAGRVISGQGFEDARLPNNSFDLVISNVPFDKTGPGVSQQEFGISFNLHNYFFARALAKAKPGGLVAFITTHNTMDASIEQRQWIAAHGDLVHAIRLPHTAFKKNAGTEVVTDIILLRKPDGSGRTPVSHSWATQAEVGEENITHQIAVSDWGKDMTKKAVSEGLLDVPSSWRPVDEEIRPLFEAWAKKRPGSGKDHDALVNALMERVTYENKKRGVGWKQRVGVLKVDFISPIQANEFFANNPELVIGRHTLAGSMYGANEYSVAPPEGGEEAYYAALTAAAEATPDVGQALEVDQDDVAASDRGDREGSYVERDGAFWQVVGRGLEKQDWTPTQEGLFRSWNKVLTAAENLLELEQNPQTSDAVLEPARAQLNSLLDAHVARHGHPSDPNNRTNKHRHLISDSSGYALIQSLEQPSKTVDPKTGEESYVYEKAAILKGRVLRPVVEPTTAGSMQEAYAASMSYRGRADVDYIASMLSVSEEVAREQLLESGLVYEDPMSGLLVDADEYLSGNVVRRLADAEKAAMEDGRYLRNADALREVRPPEKAPAEVNFQLGATWIPNEIYSAFASEVLGIPGAAVRVEQHVKSVKGMGGSSDWSTEAVSAADLLEDLLQDRPTVVWSGRGSDREVNGPATALAEAKQAEMRREFNNWVRSSDYQIGDRVVGEVGAAVYNAQVNVLRPPAPKGNWVALPDQSGEIRLTPHRKSVLARFLTQGFGMMAHGVGSGKTYALIALAHELKRTGKARKPVIVAMNSTVEQFAASYKTAYPQARLLVANPKGNFDKSRRAAFYSQMATGDWDAIILPHSTLKQIPHKPESIQRYFDLLREELMAALDGATATGDTDGAKKIRDEIQNLKEKMEKRMAAAEKNRDAGSIPWESIGVDALLVDEAHRFKNAPVVTKMRNLKNLPSGKESDNAISMMMKTADVQSRTGGKHVFFATGTPITNTMGEAFVMVRYLAPNLLKDLGINSFDDFARTFAETVTKPEATWKGQVAMTTRLAKFVNGSGLINMIRTVFDVALGNEKLGLSVPRVKGGRPEQVVISKTPAMEAMNDWILDIADAYESISWGDLEEDERKRYGAIPIVTMQAGLAAATDPRLIDPNAPDDPGSKVNRMVDEIYRIYEAGKERKVTQAVFTDLRNPFKTKLLVETGMVDGLPFGAELFDDKGDADKDDKRFDLFEEIKKKLVAKGVNPKEIWWPGNENAEQLAEKFAKLDSGEIRVVIGGTEKIGTGVNFQQRLGAVHHLNPPRDMKPAMMEQRNGRIIRQGNLHKEWADAAYIEAAEKIAGRVFEGKLSDRRKAAEEWLRETNPAGLEIADAAAAQFDIEIFEYAAENSIDSAIFSMMAAKQGFIAQALSDNTSEEEFADPADEIQLAMAEIAARTMGDEDLIRLVEMERTVKEFRLRAAAHADRIATIRNKIKKHRLDRDYYRNRVPAWKALGDLPARLFADPKALPTWQYGSFTFDPQDKSKTATPLTGSMERWLADAKDGNHKLRIGEMEIDVTAFAAYNKTDPREGTVMVRQNGVELGSARFSGAKSLIQQVYRLNSHLETQAAIEEAWIKVAERELAALAQEDITSPFADDAAYRAAENEFAILQAKVASELEAKRAARQERSRLRREGKALAAEADAEHDAVLAIVSGAAGVIAEPKVTRIWAEMQERRAPMESLAMGAPTLSRETAADPAQDARYLELAKDPEANREELQQMVNDAARRAGFNPKRPLWHGSEAAFEVFDPSKTHEQNGLFWFTDHENTARSFTRGWREENADSKLYKVYGRYEKPLDMGKPESVEFVQSLVEKYLPGSPLAGMLPETWATAQDQARDNFLWAPFKVREINEAIRAAGYDAIIVKRRNNVNYSYTDPDTVNTVAMFSSHQTKSAEPITRDRAGKIIPLSERFNRASDSILRMGATRPHLDMEADWSTWPLAEVVMDIAGVPAKVRPLMRKKPKMAPLVKYAGGEKALETALGNAGLAMGAWHGTPHKVDRFSVSKIGTGEGNQSYGWGLYFAESADVAKYYQEQLSPSRDIVQNKNGEWAIVDNSTWNAKVLFGPVKDRDEITRELERRGFAPGNLYRVDIKADPETDFLDWDKSLGEQTPKIREAFLKAMEQSPKRLPDGFDVNRLKGGGFLAAVGTIDDRHDDKVASERMLAAGIKGIRYLDGNSRNAGWVVVTQSGEELPYAEEANARKAQENIPGSSLKFTGTRNFVVFDESLVEILEENGKPVSKAERAETLALAMGAPRGTTPANWDNDEAAIRDTLDYFSKRLPAPAAMDERRREIGARTTKAEPEGAPLTLDGTPDRIDVRREIAAVRDVQLDRMRSQTHEQWVAEAKRLIEEDYDGVVRALLEHAREGEPLPNPALVKAAQIIIPRIWRHAKSTGDKAEIRDAQALTYAYLEGGTRASYVLGARRDMFKTQAERHVDFLSGIIARVPPAVRKRAEQAPTPSGKRRQIADLTRDLDSAKKTATSKSAEVEELTARIEKAKGAGKAGLAEIERLNKALTNAKRLHNASVDNAKGSIKRLGAALGEARKAKDRAEILGEAHEARLAKVEAVLRDMGLTLHDIFSHQAVVRLRGSEIVARVIEENFSAPQRAAIRFSLPPEGLSPREAAKRAGVTRDAIPELMAKFRQKMQARFLELAKNGLTLNDFMAAEAGTSMFDVTARIGEQGESLALGQSRVTDAEAAAAAKEMMEALMGGAVTVEDRRGKRKPNQVPFDIDNRVHVAQVGNTIKSAVDAGAYDMVYEYWINNILSGPQTHTVNIAGNALNMVLEYGMQRWMEATWNQLVGDPKGATFGEYGHLIRSLGQVWGISLTKAVEAWGSEESYLAADLLRDPARVGGLEKSSGFNAEGHRAIPDRLGKIGTVGAEDLPTALLAAAKGKGWKGASVGKTVRIPGRALLFMDTLFKGVVARTEVAGQAYRRGRANGLQGAALESFMRGEVNTPGSESWHAAVQKGEELTFTNALRGTADGGGLFEQLVKKLQESRTADNTLSPLAAALVGWFFPFIQTPFNIYKAGLRRTPFGLLGIGSHLLRTGIVSWREGEPLIKNYGQARLVRDLTDQTISTLITFLLLGMVEGDDDDDTKPVLLTGSRPYGLNSKGERELVDRTEGGAMTLRVGTGPDAVRFDFSRLEPFATILGSVADTLRSIKRMENGAAKVDELVKFHQYALSQATDKTFLQGIVKIGELMEPGRSSGANVARTAAQAIVPNLIRQPLRLLDDYVRDSRTAPWYYHAVPLGGFAEPRADLYGQPMKKGATPAAGLLGPLDRLARIPVDTGLAAAPVPHVADIALKNWNRMNPDKGEQYFPSGNSITSFKDLAGGKQKLTAAQLAEVERLGGLRLRVELARAITPAEAANPTEATIEKIRAARSRVFSAARDEVVRRPSPTRSPARSLRDLMGWTPPQ